MDEEEEDYSSDCESRASDEEGNSSTRSASPRQPRDSSGVTGDDEDSNFDLLGRRGSVFSAERRGSRRTSTVSTGTMPEISIRRRSRVVGMGDDSSTAGPPPSNGPGVIARASRIIAELEQDHGGLEFPLDVLRRDSQGFQGDGNGDG